MFVALTALSPDGSLMSTVDVRLPEEDLGGIVILKFWSCSRIGEYTLSTVIYEPHRLHTILNLKLFCFFHANVGVV